MARINNVNMEAVGNFIELVKKDANNAKKEKIVEGEWVLEVGKPQFKAEIKHEKGVTTLEADGPNFMGGSGIKPDPVQYCMYGLIACFAQTFASVAVERGVKLNKLRVKAVNTVNLVKPLGLADEPPTKGVTLEVSSSSEDHKQLNEILNEAKSRCPGVYCLTNEIPLEIKFEQG